MHIKEIYIKGLFGEHDIRWKLDKDINILSALNGGGKTTILSIVASMLSGEHIEKKYVGLVEYITITFDKEEKLELHFEKRKENEDFSRFNNHKNLYGIFKYIDGENSVNGDYWGYMTYNGDYKALVDVDYLSTFDQVMLDGDDIRKGANENRLETDIDLKLHNKQGEFMTFSYRRISTLALQATNNKGIGYEEITNHFVPIINILNNNAFRDKSITIGRLQDSDDSNFIAIKKGEKEISMYSLSSGEKQLLLILLTIAIQDKRECVLILDEPEISLHYNWQEKLVEWMRILNPNVQIILATHSPFILIDGLSDKTYNLSDLIER